MNRMLSTGLRSMVGLLTIVFLVYIGLYLRATHEIYLSYLLFALAGLRALLLGYDILRRRRADREEKELMAKEEQEFREEVARKRRQGRKSDGPRLDESPEAAGHEDQPTDSSTNGKSDPPSA